MMTQINLSLTAKEPMDDLNLNNAETKKRKQDKVDGSGVQIILDYSAEDDCGNVNANITHNESCICNDCGRLFHEKALLIPHIALHHTLIDSIKTTGKLRWFCDSCNAKFSTKSKLTNHKIEVHGSQIKYKACKFCDYKTTEGLTRLRRHTKTHSKEKLHTCTVCYVKLSSHDSLKRHMRIHTGERPYECEICNSHFSNSSSLKCHMQTHSGDKPFTCKTCKLKFSSNYCLKRHVRTHNGTKPYHCTVCNSKFSTNSALTRHSRIHTGKRPYLCTICDSTFRARSSLTRHFRIHTGLRPYECTICDSNFNNSSSLKRHLKVHA